MSPFAPFVLFVWLLLGAAPQQPASSINFFSLQQDKEIGADSAKAADRSLPVVHDAAINAYLQTVAGHLTANSPQTLFQYRFSIVNSKSVSTVTFPGGTVYLDRGLAEIVTNEHELAAILAHEIAHAAARHGTEQLSRQLLVQSPASIAAGLPNYAGWKEQLRNMGISFGAGSSFLRYSSDQEIEANRIAVQILVKAGYSPLALPAVLEKINGFGGTEPQVLPAYAYDHPQGAEAARQLQIEIAKAKDAVHLMRVTPEFKAFHASLVRLAVPREPPATVLVPNTLVPIPYVHPQNFYRLSYPEGWQVTPNGTNGAVIAPPSSRVGADIKMGVMFDLFDVSERKMTLEQATDHFLVSLLQRNPELQVIPGAQSQRLLDGEPALRTVMIGQSGAKNSAEISWVVTRLYYENLFYIVCVAPEKEFEKRQEVFEQILDSIKLRPGESVSESPSPQRR